MPTPQLSIIIPTHNRPQLLLRAVRSAIAQTLDDIEIIVVDDGSTPPVELPNYPQVKIVRLAPNRGGSAARNVGARAATARWITYLDDDDELLPQMAAVSLAALASADLPGPVGVLSGLAEVNPQGQIVKTHLPPTLAKGKHFCLEPISPQQSFASKQTLVVERSVLLSIGGFDESFASRVHTELFLRLNPVCSLLGLSTVTYRLSVHDGPRVSGSLARRQQSFAQLQQKHRAVFAAAPPRSVSDFIFNHAYMLNRNGYRRAAVRALAEAAQVAPIHVVARLGSPLKAKWLRFVNAPRSAAQSARVLKER